MIPTEFRFKPRTYLHFDFPITRVRAWELASTPARVVTRGFLPFLGFTLRTPSYAPDPKSGLMVRELKDRLIKVAAHGDAAIYSYYGQLLIDRYEARVSKTLVDQAVTAFRSKGGGTNINFARDVFDYIQSHQPCVALAYDVKKFFDNLDHGLLQAAWAELLNETRLPDDHYATFRSVTRFSWVERDDAFEAFNISPHNPKLGGKRHRICSPAEFRTKIREPGLLHINEKEPKGIPQGSPMSAVLSNVYMMPFDEALSACVEQAGGLYRRYCDDIIIIVGPEHVRRVNELVASEIALRKLPLHEDKNDIVEFRSDFDSATKALQYLGFTFDGRRTLLRQSSLARYYEKMRRGVRLAKQTQRKHNRLELKQGKKLSGLRRRKLHLQYTYLYERRRLPAGRDPKTTGNFLTYVYRAADKMEERLGRASSKSLKKQVRNHWAKFNAEIEKPIADQLRAP